MHAELNRELDGLPPHEDPALSPPRVLYVDLDDDLASLLDRIEEAGSPAIVVLPEGARAVRGLVATRLLQRRAAAAGIPVVVVTLDRTAIAQLHGVGIPTASTVGEARRSAPHDATAVTDVPPPPPLADRKGSGGDERDSTDMLLPPFDEDEDADTAGEEQEAVPRPQRPPVTPSGNETTPSIRVARGAAAPRAGARRIPALAILTLVILAAGAFGAWAFFFPKASIVITYSARDMAREYRAIAGQGGIPLHTAHLTFSDTVFAPATGMTQVPDGRAAGTVTLANPLAGPVLVPAGTLVATGGGTLYATQETVRVPAAVQAFSGTTNGQRSVEVRAVVPGPASNADAGAIRRIRGRLAGVILVANLNPVGGGTMRSIYTVTAGDVARAVRRLRIRLSAQASAELHRRYLRSPGRTLAGTAVSPPQVAQVVRNGRLFGRVTVTLRATMAYLHQQDLDAFASAKIRMGGGDTNLSIVRGSERRQLSVTRNGNSFLIRLRMAARVIPAIDTGNLRGLLVGRSIADARQLLDGSATYGNWTYTLHTSPDWAGRLPQAAALIQITTRQVG